MHHKTPAEHMEEARASLRKYVIPHLNETGLRILNQFMRTGLLADGQNFEDLALDLTAQEHVTRSFKEGEVIAIAPLLEAFATSEHNYTDYQATSAKAAHCEEHITAIDSALYRAGTEPNALGALIGALRTHTAARDALTCNYFRDAARTLGIDLSPNEACGQKVEAELAAIRTILHSPGHVQQLARSGEKSLEVG